MPIEWLKKMRYLWAFVCLEFYLSFPVFTLNAMNFAHDTEQGGAGDCLVVLLTLFGDSHSWLLWYYVEDILF